MVRSTIDVWQGVVALVGVTLGVIPLVQKLLTGSTGSLWQLVPGGGAGVLALTVAGIVTAGSLLVIAVLERRKRD